MRRGEVIGAADDDDGVVDGVVDDADANVEDVVDDEDAIVDDVVDDDGGLAAERPAMKPGEGSTMYGRTVGGALDAVPHHCAG